ncbi:DUF2190 family protein [Gilliamella apis]|uniref:DUF2190 domain-containing protein n=1 Tax=Gilliamella apis TaxID=1970738 RepID=A0A242NUC4_9GAMM|nr:DUF2190 family protein [Gilliamella apis]OTQ49341.1 hypothetical protein B6D06_06985 [Gilliamella apis]
MNIPGLTVAKTAEGEVKPRVIVCHGSEDGLAKTAIDGNALLIGVSTIVGGGDGEVFDVVRSGLAQVFYSEAIAIGDPITAAADGRAKKAASGDFIIGYAEEVGDTDELGSIWVCPSKLA